MKRRAPACLDFAVTSGLRISALADTIGDCSSPLVQYEDRKAAYLDTAARCRAEGLTFVPMVAEALGGSWGPQAMTLWTQLAKMTSNRTGERVSDTVMQRLQSL